MPYSRINVNRAFLSGAGAVALLLLAGAPSALAQSQSDNTSVADAARRTREQKKNAAKPARTLTNDDLPAAPAATAQPPTAPTTDSPTPIEQAKPEEEAPKTAASAEPVAQAEAPAKKHAETEAALKRAKAELAQAQGELDVLQRQAALDSNSYYSKTDFARDTDGKAKVDADTQQVNDKKFQVDELKAKVAAIQAVLGEAAEPDTPSQPR